MSETKEATYKSLLQRMVHMTEQRDFDEDLMKEVYVALPTPPAEAPSEPSVEEERWAFASWVDGTAVVCRHGWKQTNHPDKPVFRVIVRSKAADDELKAKAEQEKRQRVYYQSIVYHVCNALDRINGKHIGVAGAMVCGTVDAPSTAVQENIDRVASQISTLTAERDDLSRKLAVAEGELKRAERIASMDSSLLVDERIRRIAELETQLAEAINSQVESTEQLEREREAYETLVKEAVELRKQIATPTSSGPADEGWMEKAWLSFYVSAGRVEKDRFLAALRAHAPVARYPEVVEFLDAVGSGPWSMSAGSCEGKASYYVQSFRITKGTWFADDTLAAACRAALDSRKERSDG